MLTLRAAATALILIDLQKGIVGMPTEPYDGQAVLEKGKQLARRFRAASAPVVLVNVTFSADSRDALKAPVDRALQIPAGGFPNGWADLADGLAEASDLKITKRQWGAFYGTELDLQLRRRGITTVVIGGIATNMGVESTARAAHEDLCSVRIRGAKDERNSPLLKAGRQRKGQSAEIHVKDRAIKFYAIHGLYCAFEAAWAGQTYQPL